jgi:hypothetical protein
MKSFGPALQPQIKHKQMPNVAEIPDRTMQEEGRPAVEARSTIRSYPVLRKRRRVI